MDRDIRNRIEQAVSALCNGNKSEFCRHIGRKPDAIKDIIGGRGVAPSYDLLVDILNSDLGISPKWLMLGEGSMLRERRSRERQIPLLPFSAAAGYLTGGNSADAFREEGVSFSDFTDRGADCAIRVDGDSMYPRYKSGDILAIKILKDPTFFQWGRVYCISTTQGCIIKKLFPCPDDEDRIVCHSENSEHFPDYTITKSDVLAVAIVVGHAGIE